MNAALRLRLDRAVAGGVVRRLAYGRAAPACRGRKPSAGDLPRRRVPARSPSISASRSARVAVAFAIAMALGTVLGLAMGRDALFDRLADPWLVVLLNLPALVIIVLAYVWAGLTETAAIAAVALNKLPLAAVTVREGARSLDRTLDEMAAVFRMGLGCGCAMSCCRSLRPISPPRHASGPVAGLEDRADRRIARAGRTASASRSASPSNCSTSPHPGLCFGLRRRDARHRNVPGAAA